MVDAPIDPPRHAAAALYPYVAPVLRHVGWFAVFLVLAPVIGPRGYGLFMLALSGIAIAEALLAETACQALVDLPAIEERHWSTALVTLFAAGGAIWLVLHAVTGAIGATSDEPALRDMFQSLAILPLLGALTVVPSAALRREGRQAPLVAASAAGFAAGGGIAVSLAWAGAGPWSLVAQIIVQRLVECVVLWGIPGERIGLAWSRRHFVDLVGAFDRRALGAAWPAVSRYGPCLVVGLTLGPAATGLYMLAGRLAEALADIFLAGEDSQAPREIVRRACRVALPAVLASTLLAIALPPLLDLRWWGAVLPAQILLLGAIPSAIIMMRVACAAPRADEPSWRAVQALGGVALVALAARYGLMAVATASVGWATVIALTSLWPIRRHFEADWDAVLAPIVRPCGGAVIAGFILFTAADPVGLALAPVPALCLLTASGWLAYLLIRGDRRVCSNPWRNSPPESPGRRNLTPLILALATCGVRKRREVAAVGRIKRPSA